MRQAVLTKDENGVKSQVVEWIPAKIKNGATVKIDGIPGEFIVSG